MPGRSDDDVIEGLQLEEDDNAVYLFGRDISKIPCFKDSYLTGIYSGIGAGLLTFTTTSRILFSTHVAVGAFSAVSLAYWFVCSKRYYESQFQANQSLNTFPEEIESVASRKKRPEEQYKTV